MLQDKVGRSVTSETVAEHVELKVASTSKVLLELARKGRLIELPQRSGHFKLYRIAENPHNADLDEFYARQQKDPKAKAPDGERQQGVPMVPIEGRMFDRALATRLIEFLNAWRGNPLAPPMTVQSIARDTGLNRGFVGRFIRHLSAHGYIADANNIQTRPRVFGIAKRLPVPEPVEVKKAEPEHKDEPAPESPTAYTELARIMDEGFAKMNACLEKLERLWA